MTDVVWVLNQTQTLCVILMLRTDSIAFPSGEDGDKLPSAEEDEERVSAHHIRLADAIHLLLKEKAFLVRANNNFQVKVTL